MVREMIRKAELGEMKIRILVLMLLATLLTGCMIPASQAEGAAKSIDERAASWKLVAQNAPFYAKNPDYYYKGSNLWSRGCGPCSVANALIAAFDVEDETVAQQVMLETLYLVSDRHKPKDNGMDPANIGLLPSVTSAEYPVLTEQCSHFGLIEYSDKNIHLDFVQQRTAAALDMGKPALLMAHTRASEQWAEYVDMCRWLYDQGLEDAMLIASFMSAGTESVETPFGVGQSGHYLTFLIHVGEFQRHGTVYLLDSLPRGISRAERAERGYNLVYPFATLWNCATLRELYTVTRMQDTVIRFSLTDEAVARCSGAVDSAVRTKYLSQLNVIGRGLMFVVIP